MGVPNDTTQHEDLHHEAAREVAVHSFQQRNPHDERVGEHREVEEGYGPVEVAAVGRPL